MKVTSPHKLFSTSKLGIYLVLAYSLLIMYASLSPFSDWRMPTFNTSKFWQPVPLQYVTFSDIFINVVAYFPYGFVWFAALPQRWSRITRAVFALAMAVGFTCLMEGIQIFLPSRVSSPTDVVLNTVGALAGISLAFRGFRVGGLYGHWQTLKKRIVQRYASYPDVADFGLTLLGLWFFSQLDPTIPLLGNQINAIDLKVILRETYRIEIINTLNTVSVLLSFLSIALLLRLILRTEKQVFIALGIIISSAFFIKLIAAWILLKPIVIFYWLNTEALVGMALGFLLFTLLCISPASAYGYILGISVSALLAATLYDTQPELSGVQLLFKIHFGHLFTYQDLAHFVSQWWPILVLFFCFRYRKPFTNH